MVEFALCAQHGNVSKRYALHDLRQGFVRCKVELSHEIGQNRFYKLFCNPISYPNLGDLSINMRSQYAHARH
jgi:hypothetical protein